MTVLVIVLHTIQYRDLLLNVFTFQIFSRTKFTLFISVYIFGTRGSLS